MIVSLPGFSLFAWMRLNGVGSLPLSKPMSARVKDTLEITRFYNIQQCDQQSSLYNPHTDHWNLGMFCLFACFNPAILRMPKKIRICYSECNLFKALQSRQFYSDHVILYNYWLMLSWTWSVIERLTSY